MIRALEIGQEPDKVHLKECGECRRLVDFLARIDVSRRRPLEGASEELIGRAALIPLLTGSNRPRRVIAGTVVFDSWSQLPAVQVRDNAKGMERRLRLKAGDVTAELVAEHQPDTWEFTARVYKKQKATAQVLLKVGRRKIQAGIESCFFWSSHRPPRSIQLLTPEMAITFGPLSWK